MAELSPQHEAIIEDLQRIIKTEWPEKDINAFYSMEWNGQDLISLHHGMGTWIRNNYNLWEIPWTPEIREGVDYSPEHPDAISQTIIEELWKRGIPQ